MAISYTGPITQQLHKMFCKSDQTISVPFQLLLSENNEYCVFEEVIRFVPGKRLVASGIWNNQEVVIKLFFDKNAKQHCQRDALGIETLIQCNVPTAKLLRRDTADHGRIQVLVLEKISRAKSLEMIWVNKKNPKFLMPLLKAVVMEIATQHVLGILQKDIHFKNFLVTDERIYMLDGGKIVKYECPLDKQLSIQYFSLFLVQLGVGVTDIQKKLFDFYTKARGWFVKPADIQVFKYWMKKNNHIRVKHYRKKIFRNCSAFKKINKKNKCILYDKSCESSHFIRFLNDPESMFEKSDAVFLKKGRSSTIIKIILDNRTYVVKRYNIKNIWHRLRRCFRKSRAAKSWGIGWHLVLAGVATAKPVAFIENRFLGLRGKSYFIMEYVKAPHIGDYFLETSDSAWSQMADKVMALFQNLFTLGMTHGDLKMTNILVDNERPLLIDLDGVKEYSFRIHLRHAFKKEMKRFLQNWEKNPDVYALFEKRLV